MLTRMGNESEEPGSGSTGTGAHFPEAVRISNPGCEGNRNKTAFVNKQTTKGGERDRYE